MRFGPESVTTVGVGHGGGIEDKLKAVGHLTEIEVGGRGCEVQRVPHPRAERAVVGKGEELPNKQCASEVDLAGEGQCAGSDWRIDEAFDIRMGVDGAVATQGGTVSSLSVEELVPRMPPAMATSLPPTALTSPWTLPEMAAACPLNGDGRGGDGARHMQYAGLNRCGAGVRADA